MFKKIKEFYVESSKLFEIKCFSFNVFGIKMIRTRKTCSFQVCLEFERAQICSESSFADVKIDGGMNRSFVFI